MKKLENYVLSRGYNPKTVLCAYGEIYGDNRFEDGESIQTSRVIEYTDEYIKTNSGSIYSLGAPRFENEYKRDYELYLLKKGSDALHKTGNIKRDVYDAELIVVKTEEDGFYIGNFAEGFGFVDVRFRKEDCRKATLEELDMCDNGKMKDIKF